MASIVKVIPFILKWEGGFVKHKHDKGGATNKGVTMATWTDFCKKKGKEASVATLKKMTNDEFVEIFKVHSWDVWMADKIASQRVANICVDWSWMSGRNVVKRVQRLLGVKADGVVGAKTLAAINGCSEIYLFGQIRKMREDYYRAIVKARPEQEVFLRGWMNRLEDLAVHS